MKTLLLILAFANSLSVTGFCRDETDELPGQFLSYAQIQAVADANRAPRLAAHPLIAVAPSPAGYLLPPQFELPQPWARLPLAWQPVADPAVVGYEIWSSPDLAHWDRLTEASPATNATVPMHLAREYFRVISVNQYGVNGLGLFE